MTDLDLTSLLERKFGYFSNPFGYSLVKLRNRPYLRFLTKSIYLFNLDPEKPLTFNHPDGRQIRPETEIETDMGSTPYLVRIFFPKDKYLKAFIFHDSGWSELGLWVKYPHDDEFLFVDMSLLEMNDLLGLMCAASGASWIGRKMILAGVDAGARFRRFE